MCPFDLTPSPACPVCEDRSPTHESCREYEQDIAEEQAVLDTETLPLFPDDSDA